VPESERISELHLRRQRIIEVLVRRITSQFTTHPVNEFLFSSSVLVLPANIVMQLKRASMLGHQLESEVEPLAHLQFAEVYIIHQLYHFNLVG